MSNWWDDIGFGHEDAYANALAYRALRQTAAVFDSIGQREDAARLPRGRGQASRCLSTRRSTTRPPASWPGWRSADGQLHDYWFLWVNGAAIHYGLVRKDKANAIMDRLMAKMKEVGFTRFDLGLPGNLAPVAMKDYREPRARFGGGAKADGSDRFSALRERRGDRLLRLFHAGRACTISAGRKRPTAFCCRCSAAFDRNDFEGRDPATNRSKDWKSWDGAAFGYEGYLRRQLLCAVGGRGPRPGAADADRCSNATIGYGAHVRRTGVLVCQTHRLGGCGVFPVCSSFSILSHCAPLRREELKCLATGVAK